VPSHSAQQVSETCGLVCASLVNSLFFFHFELIDSLVMAAGVYTARFASLIELILEKNPFQFMLSQSLYDMSF
jgi:hypothetical protein